MQLPCICLRNTVGTQPFEDILGIGDHAVRAYRAVRIDSLLLEILGKVDSLSERLHIHRPVFGRCFFCQALYTMDKTAQTQYQTVILAAPVGAFREIGEQRRLYPPVVEIGESMSRLVIEVKHYLAAADDLGLSYLGFHRPVHEIFVILADVRIQGL